MKSTPIRGSTEAVKGGSMKKHVRNWPDKKIQKNRKETGNKRCRSFVTRSSNPGRTENTGVFERHDRWEKKHPKESPRLQPELISRDHGAAFSIETCGKQEGSFTPTLSKPPQPSFALDP
ncbi:hypothetical protein GCK72_024724 [Caenorhabditis remanei]|uniref:Uncharacterized protein n=1 Tax=Caenorhabditis remanei TaxID=31234 RepID=A0A6A5G023_CAERE|nr:hypothetical protein GCK72_024724 [Caenorhabditis remanei]KAF1748257.1 hypothetical protein GCK72_024724 [Caenorhabditis remanei]